MKPGSANAAANLPTRHARAAGANLPIPFQKIRPSNPLNGSTSNLIQNGCIAYERESARLQSRLNRIHNDRTAYERERALQSCVNRIYNVRIAHE
jgi:hypothetical protein